MYTRGIASLVHPWYSLPGTPVVYTPYVHPVVYTPYVHPVVYPGGICPVHLRGIPLVVYARYTLCIPPSLGGSVGYEAQSVLPALTRFTVGCARMCPVLLPFFGRNGERGASRPAPVSVINVDNSVRFCSFYAVLSRMFRTETPVKPVGNGK